MSISCWEVTFRFLFLNKMDWITQNLFYFFCYNNKQTDANFLENFMWMLSSVKWHKMPFIFHINLNKFNYFWGLTGNVVIAKIPRWWISACPLLTRHISPHLIIISLIELLYYWVKQKPRLSTLYLGTGHLSFK